MSSFEWLHSPKIIDFGICSLKLIIPHRPKIEDFFEVFIISFENEEYS